MLRETILSQTHFREATPLLQGRSEKLPRGKNPRISSVCCCCGCFRLFIGDSRSDEGEACATPCSAFRILHVGVYFSVHLEPTEVTQEGANNWGGIFRLFYFSFMPHLPPAILALNFYREKGTTGRPFPRQRTTSKLGTHELFSYYLYIYVVAFTVYE